MAGPGLALVLMAAGGCQPHRPAWQASGVSSVRLRPAALVRFRGAESASLEKPGECDCNSPAHWDGKRLYVFNSTGHPWRSAGRDVFHLNEDYRRCEYDNQANGGRWIECTWKAEDGRLYGWYHLEPRGVCPDGGANSRQAHLTAPKIGAVSSTDNGATWHDLGIVLEAPPAIRCDTENFYFAGGNGDFSVMLDERSGWLYFFISTYVGEAAEQGVAVARMRWGDRDAPVGRVMKWHNDGWAEPGLGGKATPMFPARIDWHRADADAFWGPSVHWNRHLNQYVLLLNRAKDYKWAQEGIYVAFNPDLANPRGWSAPEKLLGGAAASRWYPQVMGLDKGRQDTDKSAGRVARLFVAGESRWELLFLRPGERP
jgi:hypothetical protein